jgi:hypothetical protein
VWVAEKCLKKKLLVLKEDCVLKVNLDFRITLMIAEGERMAKMGLPMPSITRLLLSRKEHFIEIKDNLQVCLTSNDSGVGTR